MKSDLQREGKPLGKPKKLSHKYQIVLPPAVRDLLGVKEGEDVQFWEYHGSIIITKNIDGGENIG